MNNFTRKSVINNRVFILGAGFSAEAGIPLTGELLSLAMDKLKKENPELFSGVNYCAQKCFAMSEDINYSNISFTEFCTFLEYNELREYAGGERWSDAGSMEKLALRYYLAKTIIEKTPSGEKIPDLYIEFARQLHVKDIVISFNWDGLLEVVLDKLGKPYTYNFGDNAIWLCKLHGSINWRIGLPTGQTKLQWDELQFATGAVKQEVYSSKKLLSFDIWKQYDVCTEAEPFLVLPGYGKAFDVRAISTLWYKPEWAFAFTHDIYIIGLSLAPDDFFIRSYFLDNLTNLPAIKELPSRKIVIINPDPSVERNYNFILSTGLADLIRENFSIEHIKLIRN